MICPFCGNDVPARQPPHPWRFRHHNIEGEPVGNSPASLCPGSRSVHTLEFHGYDPDTGKRVRDE